MAAAVMTATSSSSCGSMQKVAGRLRQKQRQLLAVGEARVHQADGGGDVAGRQQLAGLLIAKASE
jgi:hypothetical protein